MLLLLAAASAVSTAAPPQAKAVAATRASIRVLTPHHASPATWDPAARPNQREVVKKEAGGAEIRLRLTEFE